MCNINMMGASSRCSFDQDTLLYVYLVLMDERKLHHLIAASYVGRHVLVLELFLCEMDLESPIGSSGAPGRRVFI